MVKTTSSLLFFLSLLAPLLSITATCTFPASPASLSSSPLHNDKGMFIFGSSYVDNGNNNFLENKTSNVNFTPYGVDFALGPTGRFTNGKNVIDLLGEELGLPKYLPIFASPDTRGEKIVNGVSFASGGSGILDETGSSLGVINLSHQMKNFEEATLPELEKQLGCPSTESLPNYLFVFGVGGNDFTERYFPRKAQGDFNITIDAFSSTLTTSLAFHIQKLYVLGARKFILMSLYPIGCNPIIMASQPHEKGCVSIYNKAAETFNIQLKSMADKPNDHMLGSHFFYLNAYEVIQDIIKHPQSQGFRYTTTACCEIVPSTGMCKRGGSVCENRNTHLYFDGIHPTEAVNKLIVRSTCTSYFTTRVYPFHAEQLASI